MRKSYLWERKIRMEMDKVPAAGYKIVGLPVSGFDRAHLMNRQREGHGSFSEKLALGEEDDP